MAWQDVSWLSYFTNKFYLFSPKLFIPTGQKTNELCSLTENTLVPLLRLSRKAFHLPGSRCMACGGGRHKQWGWQSWSAELRRRPGWLSGFCCLLVSLDGQQKRITSFHIVVPVNVAFESRSVYMCWWYNLYINPYLGDFFIKLVCQAGFYCKIHFKLVVWI